MRGMLQPEPAELQSELDEINADQRERATTGQRQFGHATGSSVKQRRGAGKVGSPCAI